MYASDKIMIWNATNIENIEKPYFLQLLLGVGKMGAVWSYNFYLFKENNKNPQRTGKYW